MVHSCIYYVWNDSIVSDDTWNTWAKELVSLQSEYPQESQEVGKYTLFSYDVFKDFDGSTGFNLPIRDSWVMQKAEQIRRIFNDRHNAHCRDVLIKENKYYLEKSPVKKKLF